jgi:hypothetical protein
MAHLGHHAPVDVVQHHTAADGEGGGAVLVHRRRLGGAFNVLQRERQLVLAAVSSLRGGARRQVLPHRLPQPLHLVVVPPALLLLVSQAAGRAAEGRRATGGPAQGDGTTDRSAGGTAGEAATREWALGSPTDRWMQPMLKKEGRPG